MDCHCSGVFLALSRSVGTRGIRHRLRLGASSDPLVLKDPPHVSVCGGVEWYLKNIQKALDHWENADIFAHVS